MYCGECGAKLKKEDLFCGECGAKVAQVEEVKKVVKKETSITNSTPSKPMDKKTKTTIAILVGVAGLLLAVMVCALCILLIPAPDPIPEWGEQTQVPTGPDPSTVVRSPAITGEEPYGKVAVGRRKSKELIDKARKGSLRPDDMQGGTFTISNLGMFEVDSFTAIVNPPETCILAVGRIAERAVVVNGQIVARPMMNLCLSYDHRIIDGAPAARFLQCVKHYLENPVWLLM